MITMPTQEDVRRLIRYDREAGKCYKRYGAGEEAGYVSDRGYVNFYLKGFTTYRLHRLIWLYETGSFPPDGMEIDHVNRIRSDNRWSNLRLVTSKENKANSSRWERAA